MAHKKQNELQMRERLAQAAKEAGFEGAGSDDDEDSCGCSESCASESPQKPTFRRSLWEVVRDTSPYFLLGMLIAALLVTLVPEDAVPRLLGSSSGVWAYALAVVVGIPLYVCEGEEVPLTLALLAVGLGTGPAHPWRARFRTTG